LFTQPARFLDTETKGDVEAIEGEPVRLTCEAIGQCFKAYIVL